MGWNCVCSMCQSEMERCRGSKSPQHHDGCQEMVKCFTSAMGIGKQTNICAPLKNENETREKYDQIGILLFVMSTWVSWKLVET